MGRNAHFDAGSGVPRQPLAMDAVGSGSLKDVLVDRPKDQWQVREVPLHQLKSTQERLSEDHARRIATTPKAKVDTRKKMPSGYEHPDGSVWLLDGHHRVAAHHVRGDQTARVQIRGTVAPEFHDWPAGQKKYGKGYEPR